MQELDEGKVGRQRRVLRLQIARLGNYRMPCS
jgi:hypothetical protein